MDTEARVAAIIRDEFSVHAPDLDHPLTDFTHLGASRGGTLRLDSLDLVQFVVACEEAFGLMFTDDEVELAASSTMRQWCALIDARLAVRKVLAGSVAA